MGVDRTMS